MKWNDLFQNYDFWRGLHGVQIRVIILWMLGGWKKWGTYFVESTPPTVFNPDLWNFPESLYIYWRCAPDFMEIFSNFSGLWNLVIFTQHFQQRVPILWNQLLQFSTQIFLHHQTGIQRPTQPFDSLIHFSIFPWQKQQNITLILNMNN